MEKKAVVQLTIKEFSKLPHRKKKQIIETVQSMTNEILVDNNMYERYRKKFETNESKLRELLDELIVPTFSFRNKSQSYVGINDRTIFLNAEQKCLVAQNEIDEIKKDLDTLKKKYDESRKRQQDLLMTMETTYNETRKEIKNFLRELKPVLTDEKRKFEIQSSYMKWYNKELKRKDKLVYKIKIENGILKSKLKNLSRQLKDLEHRGVTFVPVDKDEIRIKCKKNYEKLAELTQLRNQMKVRVLKQLQLLSVRKRALELEMKKADCMIREIYEKSQISFGFGEEMSQMQLKEIVAANISSHLQWKIKSHKVPTIQQYAQVLLESRELSRKQAVLDGQMRVAKTLLRRHKRLWSDVRRI